MQCKLSHDSRTSRALSASSTNGIKPDCGVLLLESFLNLRLKLGLQIPTDPPVDLHACILPQSTMIYLLNQMGVYIPNTCGIQNGEADFLGFLG